MLLRIICNDLTLYVLICLPPGICYSPRWVSAIVYYCLLLPCVMNWAGAIGYHLAANICHSFPLSTITWYRLLSFDLIYYQLILRSARIYHYLVSCGTLNYYLQLSCTISGYLLLSARSTTICYYRIWSAMIYYSLLWSITICNFLLLRPAIICLCLLLCDTIRYYAIIFYYVLLPIVIRLPIICYDLLLSAIVC